MIPGLFIITKCTSHVSATLPALKSAIKLNLLQVVKAKKRIPLGCWEIALLELGYRAFTEYEQESVQDHAEGRAGQDKHFY